jgi:hypothetical protein
MMVIRNFRFYIIFLENFKSNWYCEKGFLGGKICLF